ncbi:MAG TPA: MFS transporter [Candidatus Sulfotelmatobacter sp.]|nr:MFS transporter [Candidatus Sulfotelmatobacter sp.]
MIEDELAGAAGARRRRWLFDVPDFRRLWLVGLVVFSVRWLEMLAVGVFVYQRTGSPFLVALMTMLRMLPMALFGAVAGVVADRLERRTALIVVIVLMLSTSLSLALLAFAGRLAIWHLAVASFINGMAWATDNPVRRVMIGEVIGPARMSAAMSVDVGANTASRMLGPTVGGLLLASIGIDGAFAVSVAFYLAALGAALKLAYRNSAPTRQTGSVLARLLEGLSLARRDRRLSGTLVVTVIYNVFGWPFTSMIPVIGQDSLHLQAQGIGVLASMDGVGACVGAVLIALLSRPAYYTQIYIGGVVVYLVMLIVVALVPDPVSAGLVLLATGLSSVCFSIMQATLVYLAAPPEMRSRLYGILSLCIGLGPIGFLHLGLMADWIGAPDAVIVSGLEGLVAMALTWRWWRPTGRAG